MNGIKTRVLRLPEVMDRCGLGRSSIYQYMKDGRFPKSIQLGSKAVAWSEQSIDEWINSVVKNSEL